MMMLFPLGIFIALLLLKVENWPPRIVMGGLVFALWAAVGTLYAGIAAAILSIGILIAASVPRISKL